MKKAMPSRFELHIASSPKSVGRLTTNLQFDGYRLTNTTQPATAKLVFEWSPL